MMPLGLTMASGGLPAVGFPILVLGLVGAGLVFAPTTRTALGATAEARQA